jgi:DNA-binding winged helix-turn-helix (wHTH) protein
VAGATGPDKCGVDLNSGELRRNGQTERLPPRLLALMRYLVDRRGMVVSRDELMTAVWGHLEAASDDSVNVAVSVLRRHLGDDARTPRVIETIPRRGYRYTGAGVELTDLSALHQGEDAAPSIEPPSDLTNDEAIHLATIGKYLRELEAVDPGTGLACCGQQADSQQRGHHAAAGRSRRKHRCDHDRVLLVGKHHGAVHRGCNQHGDPR